MDIKQYYSTLSHLQKIRFAERALTSTDYIEKHLIPKRKLPKKTTMNNFIVASKHRITWYGIVSYYYPEIKNDCV